MVDHRRRATDIERVPTIRDLILNAVGVGKSFRDLEHDSGYRVKFQAFQELSAKAPKQFPKEAKTIFGIAQALDITPTAVVLAYAQSLGIAVDTRSTFAMRLPPDADQLDMDMQNALIGVVRAAVRSRSRGAAVSDELQNDSIASIIGSATDDARELGHDQRQQRNQG